MSVPTDERLMCRACLTEWDTSAEIVPQLIGGEEWQVGTITNYENDTCPNCGARNYWNITQEKGH